MLFTIHYYAAGGDLYSYMNGGMTQNLQQNGDINAGTGNANAFIPLATNNLINRCVFVHADMEGVHPCLIVRCGGGENYIFHSLPFSFNMQLGISMTCTVYVRTSLRQSVCPL